MRPFAARGRRSGNPRLRGALHENDWDFTNPSAIAGLRRVPRRLPTSRRWCAQIFGETRPEARI